MSTVAEIVDAVQLLTEEEKRELLLRLEPVLLKPLSDQLAAGDTGYFAAEFTTRLLEHFHRAKRVALSES